MQNEIDYNDYSVTEVLQQMTSVNRFSYSPYLEWIQLNYT